MQRPMRSEERENESARAERFGAYPFSRASFNILSRVLSLIPVLPFRARSTVPTETFASLARSRTPKCLVPSCLAFARSLFGVLFVTVSCPLVVGWTKFRFIKDIFFSLSGIAYRSYLVGR